MSVKSTEQDDRLARALIAQGCINENDLKRAWSEADRRNLSLRDAIISLDICVEDQINWALSRELNIPFVIVSPEMVDSELLKEFPAERMRSGSILPVPDVLGGITFVMADPLDDALFKALTVGRAETIQRAVATRSRISALLDQFLPVVSQSEPDFLSKSRVSDPSGILGAYKLLIDARKAYANRILLRPAGDGLEAVFRLERGWILHQTWQHGAALAVMTRMRLIAGMDAEPAKTQERRTERLLIGGEKHVADFQYLRESSGDTMNISLNAIQTARHFNQMETLQQQHAEAIEQLFSSRRPSGVIIVNAADERQRLRMIYGVLAALSTLKLDILSFDEAQYLDCEGVRRLSGKNIQFEELMLERADVIVFGDSQLKRLAELFNRAGEQLIILGLDFSNTALAVRAVIETVHSRVVIADRLRAIWSGRRVDLNCQECGGEVVPNRGREMEGLCPICNGYGRVRGTDLFEVFLPDKKFRERILELSWEELTGEITRLSVPPTIESQLWDGIMQGKIFSSPPSFKAESQQ